jgi:ubiquitin thioesterase OTU1
VKAGYPPHSLELVPELPLSSLGLKPGDQVIVAVKPGSATIPATSSLPAPAATSARNPIAKSTPIVSALSTQSTKADHVATEGGVLVHRVSIRHESTRYKTQL